MNLPAKIASALGVIAFVLLVMPARPTAKPAPPTPPAATPVDQQQARENQARVEARVAELASQEDYLQRKARAAQRRPAEIKVIRSLYASRWISLVATNHAVYARLVEEARAKGGETDCSICKHDGRLTFCIVCQDHPTKCPTCNGSGYSFGNELCPSCGGKGTCPNCAGTFRMICPFCDDGTILVRRPPPPDALPLQ